MNRRSALALMGKSMAACAGWWGFNPARASILQTAAPVTASVQPDKFEAQLQADMLLLSKRVYSEEGIPMLLACEDLTAKAPVQPESRVTNEAIAPAFHRYAAAWQRLHPEAPVGDVAKLVELLAYRDFASGGKDTNL